MLEFGTWLLSSGLSGGIGEGGRGKVIDRNRDYTIPVFVSVYLSISNSHATFSKSCVNAYLLTTVDGFWVSLENEHRTPRPLCTLHSAPKKHNRTLSSWTSTNRTRAVQYRGSAVPPQVPPFSHVP